MRLRVLACALVLTTAACRAAETARTAVSDSTAGALRVDPASTAGATVLELWQLRPGVTFGSWRNAHPDESFSGADSSAVSRSVGEWCAAAQRITRVGTRVLARTAFFYPPAPTDTVTADSAQLLVNQCRLGLVWVSIPTADSAQGSALTDSVRAALDDAFGGLTGGAVSFFGSAYWTHASRFRKAGVTAVTALKNPVPSNDSVTQRLVIAFAYQPNSGVSTGEAAPHLPTERWSPADTVPLDSAVAMSGLDSALWKPLRAVLAVAGSGRHAGTLTPQQADSLARPLKRWLAASQGRPLPQRAAALYVADIVLDRALCSYVRCDAQQFAALDQLRALGAEFVWAQLGASWVYQRTWLRQARTLDRDSPLGQRILLAQLNAGFDFSGVCDEGPEGFRRVIDNGERYLERVPNTPVAAEVHFLVGEAYRDIVALAHGAGDIYADSSRYGAESGPAALKAIEHYRAAMRIAPGSEVARQSWRRAWWLTAGLVPKDLRFYCVYD